MNKEWIIFHLKEALEEIESTIRGIETDPEYDYGEYSVAMTHLFHHINTAWNSRDCSEKEAKESSESDFDKWRQFPADIEMS